MAHLLSPAGLMPGAQAGGRLGALDPRVRILAAAGFAVLTVSLASLAATAAALGVALALLVASRLPVLPTLRRMAAVDGFILAMLVLLPFSVPGEPILTVAGFPASREGLRQAAEIALTANAVVLALLTLVGSMEPVVFGHALHRLRCPDALVQLVMFTVRYVGVLHEEYARLRAAMAARAFRPGTNWHCFRSFGFLIGMMLVRSVDRAERILAAMKCRGFDGRFVLLSSLRPGPADAAFVAAMAATALGLVWMDMQWR